MNFSSKLTIAFFALICSTAYAVPDTEIIWFTESAPAKTIKQEQGIEALGSYTESESMDNTHSGIKNLWLRSGDDLTVSGFVKSRKLPTKVSIINGAGQRSEAIATEENGWYHIKIDLPELGFYNAYLVDRRINNGKLEVDVVKAELLKGTCCVKNADEKLTRSSTDETTPLELIRTHLSDEGLFTRLRSGDTLTFAVFSEGKPKPGVSVTIITQEGWKKSAVSDKDAKVEFTLIRDYFPSWKDFQRRNKETFLVIAEHDEAIAGQYNDARYDGIHYRATLSGNYYPSSADYRSYAIGLGVGLFVIAFGGLAIIVFRRRRLRPYREVRFHESY